MAIRCRRRSRRKMASYDGLSGWQAVTSVIGDFPSIRCYMTNSEFKAWFDGFTEAMDGIPNKKQWDRIKTQVKKIDGAPITERHYFDRYWPYWGAGVGNIVTYTANTVAGQTECSNNVAVCQGADAGAMAQAFNSQAAMFALGQLEASA